MDKSFGNLIELLEFRAKNQAKEILYIFLEDGIHVHTQITYGELGSKAKSVAASLQKYNKQGDRIVLLFPNGIDFIIGLFGCILAGMIGIPAYPPRKDKADDRFFSILNDSGSTLILSSEAIYNKINRQFQDSEGLKKAQLLVYDHIDFNLSNQWDKPNVDDDDVAILQYTSGSTGDPKGVMLTHANILHNELIIQEAFGHDQNLIGVNWLPNFHDMGLFGTLLQPLFTGGKNVIISPTAFIKKPVNWLKAIDKFNGVTAGGPNFAFEYCIQKTTPEERKNIDLSTLRVMFCGAEPIREPTLLNFAKEFQSSNFQFKQFYPCYGLAESTLMVTGGDYKKEPVFFSADAKSLESNMVVPAISGEDTREFVSCGHPWYGTKVVIANPRDLTLSPHGEIGEIWISGPSTAKGYWNNPEETEKTFSAYLKDTGEGPFMRSGDMGFIWDDELYVSGRLKDLIIIRGINHYPQDIELTVENCHPALRKNAGACFSLDIANEERLVIVNEVERTYMRNLDANEIFEAIRMNIADEHIVLPYAIVLIRTGSIPKTSSGKIQRQACKKAYQQEELSILDKWQMKITMEPDEQSIPLEQKSLKEWLINWLCNHKDLDPSAIDPDKPITAYGLDSLLAVNLEKDVNETFGISWPIESFLRENTINQLVEEGKRLLEHGP
ncbi:MAG: AMP-binding protein [Bacteroidota bacterium]|nr:AMP-binding protein [Bacteroidota bacterium]